MNAMEVVPNTNTHTHTHQAYRASIECIFTSTTATTTMYCISSSSISSSYIIKITKEWGECETICIGE